MSNWLEKRSADPIERFVFDKRTRLNFIVIVVEFENSTLLLPVCGWGEKSECCDWVFGILLLSVRCCVYGVPWSVGGDENEEEVADGKRLMMGLSVYMQIYKSLCIRKEDAKQCRTVAMSNDE